LQVVKLSCGACHTEVTGRYDPCPVCVLEGESRRLFGLFLQARGNVRQVQRWLGVSYPTARLRVEEVLDQVGGAPPRTDRLDVLRRVRAGELEVEAAARLLRGDGDEGAGEP
jgi:hypothetical protein